MAQNILDRILETKRKELAEQMASQPLAAVQAEIASAPAARNFFTACTRPPRRLVNVIAEVKRASPSAGVIKRDFDPAAQARAYEQAGASAISVLTDRTYFGGSLDDLRQVRQAVSLPVLRKDFIIDPYQVYQARAAGADAILLIVQCLKPAELMDLLILAASLKLTCLIEIHGMEQMLQMRSLVGFPHESYSLLGINNRDLATFQVDIANTLRLAELASDPRTLVSESGIRTRADVQRLRAAGVQTVLVGETLMRSENVAATMDEVFGPATAG
jgi:indole-3-glycerol phosphate synthase